MKAKRILSLGLVGIMTVSLGLTAYAQEASGLKRGIDVESEQAIASAQISEEQKETIEEDVQKFEELAFLSDDEEMNAYVGENGEVFYILKDGEYENQIYVQENSAERFSITVMQDDIVNNFTIESDGTMILDGNKIELAQEETTYDEYPEVGDAEENDIVLASSNVTNRLTSVCPYGKASDYTYKLGSKSVSDLNLQREIEEMTFIAFKKIICAQLKVLDILGDGLHAYYKYMKSVDPHSKYMSYKVTNYAHKKYTNTYIKPIKMYGYKSNYTWYTRKSYKGKNKKETLYCTKEIG